MNWIHITSIWMYYYQEFQNKKTLSAAHLSWQSSNPESLLGKDQKVHPHKNTRLPPEGEPARGPHLWPQFLDCVPLSLAPGKCTHLWTPGVINLRYFCNKWPGGGHFLGCTEHRMKKPRVPNLAYLLSNLWVHGIQCQTVFGQTTHWGPAKGCLYLKATYLGDTCYPRTCWSFLS